MTIFAVYTDHNMMFSVYVDSGAPWEVECHKGGVPHPQSIGNNHQPFFIIVTLINDSSSTSLYSSPHIQHHHNSDHDHDSHHHRHNHHHHFIHHHTDYDQVIANSDCPLEEFGSIERVREGILSSLHDAVFFIR